MKENKAKAEPVAESEPKLSDKIGHINCDPEALKDPEFVKAINHMAELAFYKDGYWEVENMGTWTKIDGGEKMAEFYEGKGYLVRFNSSTKPDDNEDLLTSEDFVKLNNSHNEVSEKTEKESQMLAWLKKYLKETPEYELYTEWQAIEKRYPSPEAEPVESAEERSAEQIYNEYLAFHRKEVEISIYKISIEAMEEYASIRVAQEKKVWYKKLLAKLRLIFHEGGLTLLDYIKEVDNKINKP